MGATLDHLEPRPVWEHFARIAAIPRPSKHEGRIREWVMGLARERGWRQQSDGVGNLVLGVAASRGREAAPVTVLQAHLDMVCEKNKGVEHDFMTEPIRPRLAGDWIEASGTTLGADNGIGVAAALAAASDPAVLHGPLELLLTIDEETGLTGAQGLDGSMLAGRVLLNLDSEEDGKLFVGCAGGADTHLVVRLRRVPQPAGGRSRVIEVRGLRGGHSGLNIHENRGNALKLLTRLLANAAAAGIEFDLAGIEGGSKHNAIPREAEARLILGAEAEERFSALAAAMLPMFRGELAASDPGLALHMVEGRELPAGVFERGDRDRLLALLSGLPHGVLGMSQDIPGLVETSCNLAVVQPDDGALRIVISGRSSVNSTLRALSQSVASIGRLAATAVESHDGYPGWKPNMSSPVLGVVRGVYRELWGREPEVTAVHAGLECGLLAQKVPGLDMVSFGPQIEGAHSPDERVHIPSVGRFWAALGQVLDRLSAA